MMTTPAAPKSSVCQTDPASGSAGASGHRPGVYIYNSRPASTWTVDVNDVVGEGSESRLRLSPANAWLKYNRRAG